MTALMLATALASHPMPPPAPDTGTIRFVLVDANWDELVVVDARGEVRLARWCTPWDIAAAWLAGLPPEGKR
jgi:hypothetical protein